MAIHKKGLAHWEGDLKHGKGTVSTESGALSQQPYGFNTRFEGVKGTNPEELIGAREEARQIQAILHDLPEPYREVFMWRVYAELSYKQIGELFAKSDNWACVTYHRARNMIKNRLEDSNNEK